MRTSPKQFLKSRRPEQFSDSIVVSESSISRPQLEYFLDTLTNRNQEADFERFAKRLCEMEICPNLLSHTGPTGGGDSKVDSETYPISETTSLAWFAGIGNKAANERWGFAFSANKDWIGKVRDDIKKIEGTNRGYKVAYFVSSRFIRDKKRAEVEDELREQYGIDVRILDRTWILDRVFAKKYEDIVKEELHMDITGHKIKKGPLDLQREEELNILEKRIATAISKDQIGLGVVDDAMETAILSRELERDRGEIDGRFGRAERLAVKYGSSYQQFEAIYQWAWTSYWWYEDFATFVRLYPRVEERVIATDNVYNLERLANHWYGLHNLYLKNKGIVELASFKKHTEVLKEKLFELSAQETKPSASLYAKTLLLEIELNEKLASGRNIDKTLASLKGVISESKDLIGFPFRTLVRVLTEVSKVFEDKPVYEGLFNTILKVVEKRDGELSAAKLLLERGRNLLSLNRPYKAIQALGVSLRKLHKHESRDDAVRALYFCSVAYERVDLNWAAHGALLSAASLATSEFWNYGEINTMQAACYERLKWIELKIGRIPQALEWHKLDYGIRNVLLRKGFDAERIFGQINGFDLALGILFLRGSLEALKKIEYLPGTLGSLGLEYSEIALIYALGCEDQLPKDFVQAVPPEEMRDFFTQWANQYSPEHLPSNLNFSDKENLQFSSRVLGCKITASVENQQPCIEVAESVLAAIESFLSTGTLQDAIAREPVLEININISPTGQKLIEYEVNDKEDRPIISISCKKFNPHQISLIEQEVLRDIIFEILVNAIAHTIIFENPQRGLEGIMRDERAVERSLNFTTSFVTLGNVLGHQPKTKMTDWIDISKRRYKLKRLEPLRFPTPKKETAKREELKKSAKDPLTLARHSEMQTISIIRDAYWNEARWSGVAYMVLPNKKVPPALIIAFKNIEAGMRIFESWRKKFGDIDTHEEIRIAIVPGIDKDNPYFFRLSIGSNIRPLQQEGAYKFTTSVSRIHTMTPQSSQNLDKFREAYKAFGSYLLTPGYMDGDELREVISSLSILKKELVFKEAWKIGPHDIDRPTIEASDNPVIPDGIEKPPVRELLQLRKRKSSAS